MLRIWGLLLGDGLILCLCPGDRVGFDKPRAVRLGARLGGERWRSHIIVQHRIHQSLTVNESMSNSVEHMSDKKTR
jgi:hypothetical protein